MVTQKTRTVTGWSEAVREVLSAAGLTKSAIAKELCGGRTPANTQSMRVMFERFLSSAPSRRKASPSYVLRINRAIGKLTKHADVEPYLDCEALISGLLGADAFNADALVEGAFATLHRFEDFFEEGYLEKIVELVKTSDESTTLRLIAELNRAFRRVLIAELKATSSTPVGFATIRDALKRSGVNVGQLVSNQGTTALAREEFEWVVRRELKRVGASAPTSVRVDAERRILKALASFQRSQSSQSLADLVKVPATRSSKKGHA